jgi:hypothetical protein
MATTSVASKPSRSMIRNASAMRHLAAGRLAGEGQAHLTLATLASPVETVDDATWRVSDGTPRRIVARWWHA